MSWYIKIIGTPTAVKAEIQKNETLSPALKSAICEICDDKPWAGPPEQNGLLIEGNGHSGNGSNIGALKVERIFISPEPVAAPEIADPPPTG